VGNAVAYALGLQSLLDPQPGDVREPLLARELVHGHQVLVEEADEVHAEALPRVFHQIDDVARAVIADLAVVGEGDVVVSLLVLLCFMSPAMPRWKQKRQMSEQP